MAKIQVNVKLEEDLLREVEYLVESGLYSSKTEAFIEALKLLLRVQKGKMILQRIEKIREGTEAYPSVGQALAEMHEEEEF
ncbi:MAG: ribbon-helix-helix domain-containing protein [Candidatus Bathyarchaeia archaeon]|nr:hypothetical protein [Candidatus Bathyarchaeota archaeon]